MLVTDYRRVDGLSLAGRGEGLAELSVGPSRSFEMTSLLTLQWTDGAVLSAHQPNPLPQADSVLLGMNERPHVLGLSSVRFLSPC